MNSILEKPVHKALRQLIFVHYNCCGLSAEETTEYIYSRIEAASGFIFIVENYVNSAFISIPALRVGCNLSNYSDYFWNNEHLARLMNPVDAATVSEALQTLSKNRYVLLLFIVLFKG